MYEQFIDQGVYEDDASAFAREWAVECGEYAENGENDE